MSFDRFLNQSNPIPQKISTKTQVKTHEKRIVNPDNLNDVSQVLKKSFFEYTFAELFERKKKSLKVGVEDLPELIIEQVSSKS
jgi:hypothetical protein